MRNLITAAGIVAAGLALTPAMALAAPETYALEPSHVDVLFAIDHLGFSMKRGEFKDMTGTLVLDADKPENSKVDITVKIASIDTHHAGRDKDLMGAMFFDAANFPTMHFVSTKVTRTGEKTARIAGDLTIKGVTKPFVLDAKLNKIGVNSFDRKPTAGFAATGSLKRSDFGVKGFLPAIGDDVAITIEAEFNHPAAPGAGPGGPPPGMPPRPPGPPPAK